VHVTPATLQFPPAVVALSLQRLLSQLPVQQSAFVKQPSLTWRQYETSWQTLPVQTPVQHCAPVVQLLPLTRQPPPPGGGAQKPAVQMPEQQFSGAVQAAAVPVELSDPQVFWTHVPVASQKSPFG
jgi:hypothetical protein